MARKIIILEQDTQAPPNIIAFTYAMWATVPAARQTFHANASATSGVKNATGAELAAIQAGQVLERVESANISNDGLQSIAAMWPTIQATLLANLTAFQAQVSSDNPWNHYGTSWDGSTWTVQTIA